MAYRATLIDGKLTVESCPERGTRVTCVVPLKNISKEAILAS